MPHGTLGRQHHQPDDTARAAIPFDGLLQGAPDKADPFLLRHVLLPVVIAVAVDVGRAGPANGVCLLVERSSEGNLVDLTTVSGVVSSDDDAGTIESAGGHSPE